MAVLPNEYSIPDVRNLLVRDAKVVVVTRCRVRRRRRTWLEEIVPRGCWILSEHCRSVRYRARQSVRGCVSGWYSWISRDLGLPRGQQLWHHARAVPVRVCSQVRANTLFCKLTRPRHRLRSTTVTPRRVCARRTTYTLPDRQPPPPTLSSTVRVLALLVSHSLSIPLTTHAHYSNTAMGGFHQKVWLITGASIFRGRRVPDMATHSAFFFFAPLQAPHQASASVS